MGSTLCGLPRLLSILKYFGKNWINYFYCISYIFPLYSVGGFRVSSCSTKQKFSFYVFRTDTQISATYLWFNGGNLCISSKDVEREFLLSATRCDTKASHRIKRKYITDTIEIIDPI